MHGGEKSGRARAAIAPEHVAEQQGEEERFGIPRNQVKRGGMREDYCDNAAAKG